ncbi:cytochrome P450 hydroxylase [Longimycelium tulufanense]|uniref:Cytochrome P450 hydroxylase n=1 Tax=Longimycelium tulufanense TaxID=907463 RepID=A0A8J3C9P3_9PSEU|nr:cytochrome P450 [Longimycelium tulufanense]GGM61210.1 cytochrome P450 hydroxylase [Longimycelium tulufanense]
MRTVDLFDDAFVRDPYSAMSALREHTPVHYDDATGLWLVSRYNDVRDVLLDAETFRPDNALTAVTPIPVPALRVLARAGFALPPTLANNGTETHPGLRRLVARFFTVPRVADAVPLVERIAADQLAAVEAELTVTGECDLVPALTRDLPCRVLLTMLGLSDVDLPALKAWSTASLELFWGNPDAERQQELAVAAGEFHRWLAGRVRAAGPAGDDLFSALARHRLPDGSPLGVKEAVGVCYFLLIAGQETTTQLLSTALRRLVARPELWRALPTEAGLAEACVEEVLRREPPVTTWRRVTSRPTRLGGVDLPAGAQLLLMLAGAGSDPEVFDDPERFCPARPNARRHLAFGLGRHLCLGAELARVEAAVVVRAAAERLPDLTLVDDDPPMLNLVSFRAPLRVRVAYESSSDG